MLSPGLHKQIFKNAERRRLDPKKLGRVEKHLQDHGLWNKSAPQLPDVDLDLGIVGENIEEHFESIARKQYQKYRNLAGVMSSIAIDTPPVPGEWKFQSGWTKYNADGTSQLVSAPDEQVLVFDVEVCVSAGNFPVLATALSPTGWYGWVSEFLVCSDFVRHTDKITVDMHIPLECDGTVREKLVIGHHVAYDRSHVSDQYNLKETKTRFLDTLSLHMCVSGLTGSQRSIMNTKTNPKWFKWMGVGTTNSLAKVYEFYCEKELVKDTRDLFVSGSMDDIRAHFQECMRYCASDVAATREVFQVVWPKFTAHAPHPVTFGGMLEMGTSYLPINYEWPNYTQKCEQMYTEVTSELKNTLMAVADEALKKMIGGQYEDDPWLCNLDWSLHKTAVGDDKLDREWSDPDNIHGFIAHKVAFMAESKRDRLHMPGYPKWYRDICMRASEPGYKPGPQKISTLTKVTPYLLQMTWKGFPLHHIKGQGWGYLVSKDDNDGRSVSQPIEISVDFDSHDWFKLEDGVSSDDVTDDEDLVPGYHFYRLPHKDGADYNVGNPLAKDFLSKMDDGTLSSCGSYNAKHTIGMNKMLSYWRGARKRIMGQKEVWRNDGSGVILPHVITAGTVTRRAVEPTWLTVSNPKRDRIGSEVKAMVRAPAGYCLVGADVDSQELWIAAVLGDAQFSGIHGSTAFGWMTLQGNKSDGTDLHSKTADTIGTDRDIAKIFNYGRIYGAGDRFAVRLLKQHNPSLTDDAAKEIAKKLYTLTKGVKMYQLTRSGARIAHTLGMEFSRGDIISYDDLKRILSATRLDWSARGDIVMPEKMWSDGTESEMFNKLESIARSQVPQTPVLACRISNALLPRYVGNDYMTSRVNWAVQSSGVDYLHLLLTCTRWLIEKFDIDARFCISIHDEVRYIVHEKDKYRAALALQISNLLTRSLFSYKLNMMDLPLSVAFFSAVDIDTVWRKEVDFDCVTPSNEKGLFVGHNVQPGESVDIYSLMEKLKGDMCE